MKNARRFTSALAVAAIMAAALMFSSAKVEAKGKKNVDDSICTALAAIINYPYTSDTIRAYSLSLFNGYGCDPALLN